MLPGSKRIFRTPRASGGTTFWRMPACRMVGAMVSRSIEFHTGFASEIQRAA